MRTTLSKKDLDTIPPGPITPVPLSQSIDLAEIMTETKTAIKTETKTEEQQKQPDSYSEQIVKNIPAEVVAFYIPALGAAAAGKEIIKYDYVVWAIFGLALVGTFVYMRKSAKKDLMDNKVKQHIGQKAFWKSVIATVAFVIWAFYLGGPFTSIAGYSIYGTLLILGYTFITPALYDAIPIPFPSLRRKKT